MRTLLSLLAAGLLVSPVHAGDILDEPMNYASIDEFKANWTFLDSRGGAGEIRENSADPSQPRWLFLRNALVQKDLPQPLKNQDWTLKFKMLQSEARRGGWVGLFDETRTKGYAVLWDSGNSGIDYPGTVFIRKFRLDQPLEEWGDNGEAVTPAIRSGHPITQLPFAEFELSWKHDTGLLTLAVDGVELTSYADTEFPDLSQIVIKGNWQSIDDIVVTSP